MERIGAFEREVIVLIAPTGSGWIDPYAIDGIEYLHNGNTAAVAIQYSYLASWMVMIGNQDLTRDAAGSLLAAVNERVSRLPEEERPQVLICGESLGAFGWERLFETSTISRLQSMEPLGGTTEVGSAMEAGRDRSRTRDAAVAARLPGRRDHPETQRLIAVLDG